VTAPPLVHVGIGGAVVALGGEPMAVVWKVSLAWSGAVHVIGDGARLFAGGNGELHRLDPATGATLWKNKLSGLGWGLPSIALVPPHLPPGDAIFVGLGSSVVAIDTTDGRERWRQKLGGMLTTAEAHVAYLGAIVAATCDGEIWALDPDDGHVVWHDELSGNGTGHASIAPAHTAAFDLRVGVASKQQ
jgi:hypothetical protein